MYFISNQNSLLAELEAAINRTQSKLNHFTSIKEGKIEAKISKVDLTEQINRLRGELLAYKDSLAMVKAFVQESNKDSLQEVTESTETTYQVLPLDTKFNWEQDNYPSDAGIVYMEFDDGYHPVKKINRFTFKSLLANKIINLRHEDRKQFYGDVIVSEVVEDKVESKVPEVLEEIKPKFIAKLEKDALDRSQLVIQGKHNAGGHQQINILLKELSLSDIDSLIKQLMIVKDNIEYAGL